MLSSATFKLIELNDDRSPSIPDDVGRKSKSQGYYRTVTNSMTGWKNASWLQHCISVKDPPPVVGIGSKEVS